MYCKHCGKLISDDSSFCQYCGGKLKEELTSQADNIASSVNDEGLLNECGANTVMPAKKPIATQSEAAKKLKDKKIANEIIGNLKMMGLAAALFAAYMLGFIILHQKDITKYDYETHTSYYGESCYDPSSLTGNWKFHWEQHYYELLYFQLHNKSPLNWLDQPSPEQYLKEAEKLEKEWNKRKASVERLRKNQPIVEGVATQLDMEAFKLEQRNPNVLKEEAKEEAAKDIQNWNETINDYRKIGYEDDLKKNAIYASIICLLVMILGRYFVKLIKWVDTNKSS